MPESNLIADQLITLVKRVLRLDQGDSLNAQTDLRTLAPNSLAMLDLLLEIQQTFGVDLLDGELGLRDLSTIESIASVVSARGST